MHEGVLMFEVEPEFQAKLDWADAFVREECEPLDLAFPNLQFIPPSDKLRKILDPLKQQVRDKQLWATHLGPDLGGQGYGSFKLALLNEILGRSNWAPIVFGCQAPDTGNAEIIAHYGTQDQKDKYLTPLLNGEIFSSYSMTEPAGGSDPTNFECSAVRDGDDWIINGFKYFSSNAGSAEFLIVMVVTNPDVSAYNGMSMFLVPTSTPGVHFDRFTGLYGEPLGEGHHPLVRYENVRVNNDALLGGEGNAFKIAQTRLGGGRIHHAMRTVGLVKGSARHDVRARAESSYAGHEALGEAVRARHDRRLLRVQLRQFRLFVLRRRAADRSLPGLQEGP